MRAFHLRLAPPYTTTAFLAKYAYHPAYGAAAAGSGPALGMIGARLVPALTCIIGYAHDHQTYVSLIH